MKRIAILSVLCLVLLAGSFSLSAYDASPHYWKVAPECIYAAATGGGTWVTEIEITNMAWNATSITVLFAYGGGVYRGPFTLVASMPSRATYRYTNILATIDSLDSGSFTYYGRVGAVWFWTGATADGIQLTAKTVNGNYGKTLPGITPVAANTGDSTRQLMIPGLVNSSTYRTFCGFFNSSGSVTLTATFYVISSASWNYIGSSFTRTFAPYEYLAFNPYAEAGLSAGTYTGNWLYVSMSGGTDSRGLIGFGSIANNNSNDPAALLALPYTGTASGGEGEMPLPTAAQQ